MLNVNHIKKNYQDFSLDCSFELKPGTITGLIGKNGSGKTTLFKIIMGLLESDSGEVSLFNKKLTDLSNVDKQKVSVIFSDAGFHSQLRPNDLIPILKNFYPDFDEDYFIWEVKRQKLGLDKPIKKLSTGMEAKLKLIIALSQKPKILLLDEPTLGLDVLARNETYESLQNFMNDDQERSILISSHNSSDLENLCDNLILIDNGQILLYEETDKILSDYALIKVTEDQFKTLPKDYILRFDKQIYGYSCLTNQKQFYLENCPDITIEPGNIDDLLTLMTTGETL